MLSFRVMNTKTLYKIAGISYIGIFFTAIFANFFVLDGIKQDPLAMVTESMTLVSLGALAFMLASVLDIVVAWVFKVLFSKHPLTTPSTYFRLTHAVIMGVAVFALVLLRGQTDASAILNQVAIFETMWLIGLFFFGVHLLLLANILKKVAPRWITIALFAAGVMYMIDTAAHFVLSNYSQYADIFLTMVAIPSILGEMALSIWLLLKSKR